MPDLRFHNLDTPEDKQTVGLTHPTKDFATESELLDWVIQTGNRLVNALRPRLANIASNMAD